jgi:protein-disulfide isomerase
MSTSTPPTKKERQRQAREVRQAAERKAAERERRRRRAWQVGAAAGLAAALVAIAILVSQSGRGEDAAYAPGRVSDGSRVAALLSGIPQRGIALGAANAPVTLVEFADLKCPICRIYSQQVLPQLIADYVRPGRLRIEFRAQHFVGEQTNPGDSLAAARMAEAAAAQNRLWHFTELFYANQQDEGQRYVTDAFLRDLGQAIPRFDVDRALGQRNSPTVGASLRDAQALFERSGFTGTPSFLLGRTGRPLRTLSYSRLSPDEFTEPIDGLLGR